MACFSHNISVRLHYYNNRITAPVLTVHITIKPLLQCIHRTIRMTSTATTAPAATTALSTTIASSSCGERDTDWRMCTEQCSPSSLRLQRALTTYANTPPLHRPRPFTGDAGSDATLTEVCKPEERGKHEIVVMPIREAKQAAAAAPQKAELVTGIIASGSSSATGNCLVVGVEFFTKNS